MNCRRRTVDESCEVRGGAGFRGGKIRQAYAKFRLQARDEFDALEAAETQVAVEIRLKRE